jgi:hypothetical protein
MFDKSACVVSGFTKQSPGHSCAPQDALGECHGGYPSFAIAAVTG